MSQIRLYPIDTNVQGNDKVIGTEGSTKRTKNFTVSEIVQYINRTSAVDSQTLRYKFQVLQGLDTLELGTISFDPPKGNTVNFTDVTNFVLSQYTLQALSTGTPYDISNFYTSLIGSQVFISSTYDISNFGVYDWDSSGPSRTNDFYSIGLTPIAGQGAFKKDEEYFISLLQWNPSANSGDKTFVFTQGTPIYQWDITHDLNKFPSVSVVDSFNEQVIGSVDYITKNRLTVTFASPFSGQAYCN